MSRTSIKLDERNYRLHSEKNKALIQKSLKELGAGRSILASADGTCLAGNGVLEQAKKLNIPLKIVETSGDTLVVVCRKDVKSGSQKAKELALSDNSIADTSAGQYDEEFIHEDFKDEELAAWGVDLADRNIVDDLEKDLLKNDINSQSDIFSITFNFPKSREEEVKSAIKTLDRSALAHKILELILAEAHNA